MRRDRHQVGACVYSKKRRAICGAFCMGKYAYETKCFPGWIVLRWKVTMLWKSVLTGIDSYDILTVTEF